MQVAMIGLGRMGGNMAHRLLRAGHQCVVYDAISANIARLTQEGAQGASSLEDLVSRLQTPRVCWLMLPAAVVESMLSQLASLLSPGDVVIDGGNSEHRLAIARAQQLGQRGIVFLDVGTSGGVWGLECGYCMMIGGDGPTVARLHPIFDALAPGPGKSATPAHTTASKGYLHCGGPGAGHFVKMVHNAIEYGVMAAYAEGFNLLAHAGAGHTARSADAETAPLNDPTAYHYDFDLPAIAELWRHGSVIRSWLLDLTADALQVDPTLKGYAGRVADSGEGRWALKSAVDLSVPAPVLGAALFGRFSSRAEDEYAQRLLSAMREQFGGHREKSSS
ncbi:MAG: phosphogluconate dehydrogenase (NAD(+)-dependent, decarboxylating) [Steroidobacteraceae bacterium]